MGTNTHIHSVWADAPLILAIARIGSLTLASEQLSIDRTTLRRRVLKFEQNLGVRVFHSDKGQLSPTDEGVLILEKFEKAEAEIENISGQFGHGHDYIEGDVRISFPPHIAHILMPVIASIANERPSIQLDINATFGLTDLELREAEIAVRVSKTQPQYPLYSELITPLHGAYYKGIHVDLNNAVYVCNQFENEPSEEARKRFPQIRYIRCHDYSSQLNLLQQNGVGRTIHELAMHIPNLQRIDEKLYSKGWKLWLVSHSRTRLTPRIKWVYKRLFEELSVLFHPIE